MNKTLFLILFVYSLLNSSEIKNDFDFKYLEDIKNNTFFKNNENKRPIDSILKNDPSKNITIYEQLIIEVDSSKNSMILKGKLNDKIRKIQTYVVSTGKKDIKKPTGEGSVTSITLNPFWYPTLETIELFKKRGINLPTIVPPRNKYNYMGAAKINLSHTVDGKNTFRIHGTINESTIGTNESSGCIRMKNSEVTQLAILLKEFSEIRNINSIKVFLK